MAEPAPLSNVPEEVFYGDYSNYLVSLRPEERAKVCVLTLKLLSVTRISHAADSGILQACATMERLITSFSSVNTNPVSALKVAYPDVGQSGEVVPFT